MKKCVIIFCGCVLVCLVVLAADKKQPTSTDTSTTVEQLTREIDSLQTKLKAMDKRLAKLEQTKNNGNNAQNVLPQIIIPPAVQNQNRGLVPFADPNHPPKIWGEGECNGWKYYMIPLSASDGGTAAQIPLVIEASVAR